MIRFNLFMAPGLEDVRGDERRMLAADRMAGLPSNVRVLFMSHRTGDTAAEVEARRIMRMHRVAVYLAEWDPNVQGDAPTLPDYIMRAIKGSRGFLVYVIDRIASSMWVGYEIGGAHASEKPRARIEFNPVVGLPSVVAALNRLGTTTAVDAWVRSNAR